MISPDDRPAKNVPPAEERARVSAEVVIVGAGPAGLTAARELAHSHRVLVLEREVEAGGIPRHSNHLGYGMRDLHRVMAGPGYARSLVASAVAAGVEIRTESTVTGWAGDRTLEVTGPGGRINVAGDAVVLSTGARERPRSARLVPGDRPAGVLTTGQLQQLVHLRHRTPGRTAVVVGAELVSWSAVLTLREAGCSTVLMTSEYPRGESYAAFRVPARVALKIPVATSTRVVRVIGREQVTGVEIENVITGRRLIIDCDAVVFTGSWIPDNELVRLAGIDLDLATLGPRVDMALRTSRPGVFAAGNVIHAVDTADVAALDGRHVATSVRRWIENRPAQGSEEISGVRIVADAPMRWVAPSLVRPGGPAPPRSRLLLWAEEYRAVPRVRACQDGREIGRRTLPWAMAPGRVFRVPWSLLAGVDPRAGDVVIGLG